MGEDWEAEHDKLIMLEENDNEDFNYEPLDNTPTQVKKNTKNSTLVNYLILSSLIFKVTSKGYH